MGNFNDVALINIFSINLINNYLLESSIKLNIN